MTIDCSDLLAISISINFSVGVYFCGTPFAKAIVEKLTSNSRFAQKLSKLYKEKPGVVRKFFRDELLSALLFLCGIYLISHQETFAKPFLATPEVAKTVFAVDLGNYIFKLLQDLLLRKETSLCTVKLLHYAVAVLSFAIFVYFQQNAISGVIALLFEGSIAASQLLSFLRMLKLHKNGRLYFYATVLSFIFTLFFMVLCPLTIMTIVLLHHDPLKMRYVPLSFFFTNIVFFLILNSWLVKTSYTNLRRRIRTRKGATRYRDGTRLVIEDEELNNCSMLQGFPTVIIPNDSKFRLTCPVSNLNLNASSSSGMSNIVASKRERSLPAFDTIVNQMDILQDDTRRIGTRPTEV